MSFRKEMGEGYSRIHNNDFPNPLPNTRLNQQRHIHNTNLLSPNPSTDDTPKHRSPHGGMHDPIQLFPLPLVVEYHGAEFLPIQVPVRLEYILAEVLDDGGISGCTRQNRLACEQVCVDDWVSTGPEKRGNRRLPSRYTTR